MLPSFCPYINMRERRCRTHKVWKFESKQSNQFAMIPVLGDKNKIIIPDITTTEIKCGR